MFLTCVHLFFLIVLARTFKTILNYYGDIKYHYYISHLKTNASYSSQINYNWLILLYVETRAILALNLPCVRQLIGHNPYNGVKCISIFLIKDLLQNTREVENVGYMKVIDKWSGSLHYYHHNFVMQIFFAQFFHFILSKIWSER